MLVAWILNDLPSDGIYTPVAKLIVYGIGILLSVEVLKFVLNTYHLVVTVAERVKSQEDRDKIVKKIEAMAEVVKGYATLIKHHGEKSENAVAKVAEAAATLPGKLDQKTEEVKETIVHSAEQVVEKLSGAGPGSGIIPQLPDLRS